MKKVILRKAMATGLENLWIYKLAEDLEVKVFEVTKSFPWDEIYRSVDQLRRSSSSVSDNIAEYYHKTTTKEKKRFLDIAKGEIEETRRGVLKSARKSAKGGLIGYNCHLNC